MNYLLMKDIAILKLFAKLKVLYGLYFILMCNKENIP
jgi:hypothetical protein